ncbi:enolase C-terminal domain-like protein [Glycomyces halotolerans]
MNHSDSAVTEIGAAAYRIPTASPEADGTLEWDATTIVVAQVRAGGVQGTGWTYADASCAELIRATLAPVVRGRDVLDPAACWHALQRRVRNLGRPGLVSCAMSALDIALWDACARLLDRPLSRMFGRVHDSVDVYASGGFTTWDDARLADWVADSTGRRAIPRVKIKIGESWGREIERDLARVALTRETAGADAEVMVDANGGYTQGQARRVGARMREWEVSWFEEPVSSDDLDGLRVVRDAVECDVAAGEYGYDLAYFTRMLDVRAVDCVQVDLTRCGGCTEWTRIAALAASRNLEVSAHCAPNLSVHLGAATPGFRHIEWFFDHDRIESLLFDGAFDPEGGRVSPPLSEPGHGMAFKGPDAEPYRCG